MPAAGRKSSWPLAVVALIVALRGAIAHASDPATTGPPPPGSANDTPVEYRCDQPGSNGRELVDRVQRSVYLGVCGTARWFDGLFGTRRYDQDSDATFGRLALSTVWDDREDFDTRLRLRARLALPALENRLQLLFGRVDDDEIVRDTPAQAGSALPSNFARVDDDAWLLGLGYSKQGGLENGFDFSTGVRLRFPLDAYTKGTYRHNFILDESTTIRARQTVFWRDSRGLGETTEIDLDRLLSPTLLLRWDNTGTLAEDVEKFEWTSALILFQSVGDRRGFAYTGFVRGIVDEEVPLQDYGFEVRYRRQAFREWLFLELRSSLTWPRETRAEDRDINPGVGIGFEMYFGPVPASRLQ